MGYTFRPIQKKNFADLSAAQKDHSLLDRWMADYDSPLSYEDWLKSKGHTIGATASQAAGKAALHKLRSYLNAAEPELVYYLTNTWNAQSKAITYKELREAILNGDIDQAYLMQWHNDYSNFVTDHLQQAWEDAMTAATADMAAKYPEWNFDPMADGVKKWTQKRAASFVTNSTTTQIMGLRAIVKRAAVLEDINVDLLSRAIRPMVGLTYQQGVANVNYFESLIQSGMSEKKATDLSIRYSARMHRYRGYNIARTELAFAYNQGSYLGTKQAQEAGYMGEVVKIWSTADDERRCEVCGGLDGKTIAMDDDFDFNTKLSTPDNPTIRKVPPAHPSCRCSVLYKEISPPQYKPTENPNKPPDAASERDDAPLATVPGTYKLPDNMTYNGPASLGGTGKSYIYTDGDGQKWLFKPGTNKDGSPAIFRSYVQEAGYKVQYIVDPETAVPVACFTDSNGTFGAIQKMVNGSSIKDELYKLYHGQDLPAVLKSEIQREHVTDWLIANFDGHSKQFVADSAGRLVGIDKDQAFRYLQHNAAKTMSYSFHPNAAYGENEPIYNSLYRMFAKGDIDLDLNDVLPYIKRVESIPNSAYREIFREYAENLNGKGKAAEALLDDIVERKASLRETYRAFYEELLEERTGRKVVFKFADEGAAAVKTTVSAQTMTKEAAMKLTSADLKKMAKSKGIAYAGDMTKAELATCISDPTQIPVVQGQVKAKIAARKAARTASTAPTSTKTGKYTATNGVYNAGEIFDDFSGIPKNKKLGLSVASDAAMVEGQSITVRRVKISGNDYIEISGKLTEPATAKIRKQLGDARTGRIVYGRGPLTEGIAHLDDSDVLTFADGIKLRQNGLSFELVTDKKKRALMGSFRVRVLDTGDGIADAAKVKAALKNDGLEFVLDTPTATDEDLLKKARLLFQKNPQASIAYGKLADKARGIEKVIKEYNVGTLEIGNMVKKEVYPGYYTYVMPGMHKTYQKEGLEYLWSGVRDESSVVAMVKSGGHASSLTRIKTGFKGNGASIATDIETGGADNVFARVATKVAQKSGRTYTESFASGSYQVLVKPSVTDRTDWYAYHDDEFGTTKENTFSTRPSALEFFHQQNINYSGGNEMMFRHGIDIKDWLGIDCKSQTHKDRLIDALKSEGITQINGTPVEKFIRVNTTVGQPWK